MDKFNKHNSRKPKPKFKLGENAGGSKEEKAAELSGKKAYKAKRSFTRNKDFRKTTTPTFKKDLNSGTGTQFEKKERSLPFKRKLSSTKSPDKNFNERKGDAPERNYDEKKRVTHQELVEGKADSKPKFHPKDSFKKKDFKSDSKKVDDGLIRLNKYLSNAGIASRRDADNLILGGTVRVNGEVITTLGHKINATDKVTYGDAKVKSEKKMYLLLNKPKDYISTVEDTHDRKTVMELIKGACRERLYPVGRLDRNTTGLLLFTNDGDLTKKLTHPKFEVKKLYHVSLNKGLKPEDFAAIIEGIELEDGIIKADDLAFVGEGKKEVGIKIHSGRNRIVRRIFEHLGYDIIKLDRVSFAGLTKKDLPRGKYRFLDSKEVSFLKMLG